MNITIITVVLLLIFLLLFFLYMASIHIIEKRWDYTKLWNEYIAKQAREILAKRKHNR